MTVSYISVNYHAYDFLIYGYNVADSQSVIISTQIITAVNSKFHF